MFTPLEKVGLLFLTVLGYKIAKELVSTFYVFLAPALSLNANLKKMGQWAVITGGTDGLGKAFAERLAKMGIDIVLISRTRSRLDAVAAELTQTYGINTKVIEADFSEGSKIFQHIEKELYGMDIGVLVNNVGISYPHPELFLDLPNKEKVYHDIIECNINSMLGMCQVVMAGMVEHKRGVVINVSSTAADIPSPLLSVYGASKVFVSKFSKDLAAEYRRHGIIVTCLVPGYVATKMSKIKKPTWMAPSPKNYVTNALKNVGVETHSTGYYPHTLLLRCIKLMEGICPRFAEWMIITTMENIRARALRKIPQYPTRLSQ